MSKPIQVMKSYEDRAIDALVNILNEAKFKAGQRLNLFELSRSRNEFLSKPKVSLKKIKSLLGRTCEKLIAEAIEKKWKLTDTLKYTLRYIGSSSDESAHFLYYEAVFSQPTEAYPIPQATVSVYFRVEDKHLEPPEVEGVPEMTFRIEGQFTDHNVRDVLLTVDWILALIKMKINVFERIEALQLF